MVKRIFRNIDFITLVTMLVASISAGCGGGNSGNGGSASSSAKESPESRGEQIVAEYVRRDAAPFRKSRIRFTITSDSEPVEIHELDVYRKQTDDETRTLTQVIKPAEDRDLATLAIEAKGKKTVIVTYAVSRDTFSETDTNKMFFGGLTAGELLGEWGKFDYRLIGEKELDGRKAFEVEGKLKPTAGSVIARMNLLFRADDYLPAELHLYDSTAREIRAYRVKEFKDVPANPYAARTEVDNPIRKTHILIEVLSREFPASIDDSMFSREKLKEIVRK